MRVVSSSCNGTHANGLGQSYKLFEIAAGNSVLTGLTNCDHELQDSDGIQIPSHLDLYRRGLQVEDRHLPRSNNVSLNFNG